MTLRTYLPLQFWTCPVSEGPPQCWWCCRIPGISAPDVSVMIWSLASEDTHTGHTWVLLQHSFNASIGLHQLFQRDDVFSRLPLSRWLSQLHASQQAPRIHHFICQGKEPPHIRFDVSHIAQVSILNWPSCKSEFVDANSFCFGRRETRLLLKQSSPISCHLEIRGPRFLAVVS